MIDSCRVFKSLEIFHCDCWVVGIHAMAQQQISKMLYLSPRSISIRELLALVTANLGEATLYLANKYNSINLSIYKHRYVFLNIYIYIWTKIQRMYTYKIWYVYILPTTNTYHLVNTCKISKIYREMIYYMNTKTVNIYLIGIYSFFIYVHIEWFFMTWISPKSLESCGSIHSISLEALCR